MDGDVSDYTGVVTRAKQTVEVRKPSASASASPNRLESRHRLYDSDLDVRAMGAHLFGQVCKFTYTGASDASGEATRVRQEEKERRAAEVARLRSVPEDCLQLATALLSNGALGKTLTDEALLAIQPDKLKTWGKHYLATLPQMLRAE